MHGNELSGPSGEIASPMFPHSYHHVYRPNSQQEVTWRVTVAEGMGVVVTFSVFEIEMFIHNRRCDSRLTVRTSPFG